MRMLNQLSMLLDRKLMETRNNRTVGIRERLTNAETRRVRSFEPTTPRRRSKISLTRFRTIRKISRMIRMMLMLIRPKIRAFPETGRGRASPRKIRLSIYVIRTMRNTVTMMMILSRFLLLVSRISSFAVPGTFFIGNKTSPDTSRFQNPTETQKRKRAPCETASGPHRVLP